MSGRGGGGAQQGRQSSASSWRCGPTPSCRKSSFFGRNCRRRRRCPRGLRGEESLTSTPSSRCRPSQTLTFLLFFLFCQKFTRTRFFGVGRRSTSFGMRTSFSFFGASGFDGNILEPPKQESPPSSGRGWLSLWLSLREEQPVHAGAPISEVVVLVTRKHKHSLSAYEHTHPHSLCIICTHTLSLSSI